MATEPTTPIQEETMGAPAPVPEPLEETLEEIAARRAAETVAAMVAEVPAPEPEPEAPAEVKDMNATMPTFSEQLQTAISRFSADVGSLKSLELTVGQAEEEVTSAQRALTEAESSQGLKLADRASGRTAAVDSRDGLIAVLQSWSP